LSELLLPHAHKRWHKLEVSGRSFEVIARSISTSVEDAGWVLVIRVRSGAQRLVVVHAQIATDPPQHNSRCAPPRVS